MNTMTAIKPTHIPVFKSYPWKNEVTVQVKEDGIVTYCNHAGAKWRKESDTIIYQSFDGEHEHTFDFEAYHCDRCPAWSYDGEDWNE